MTIPSSWPYARNPLDTMTLYHGTDADSARDITEHGIDMYKSEKGYFGRGFYLATDEDLARSNYAEFSGDDEGGVVLKFKLVDGSGVLNLDDPDDFERWKASGLENHLWRDDFHELAISKNITGVMDLGSVGGVAIYDPKIVSLVAPNPPKGILAAVYVDGEFYTGPHHGAAIQEAIDAGAIERTPSGRLNYDDHDIDVDLFQLPSGEIIDRFEADKRFGFAGFN